MIVTMLQKLLILITPPRFAVWGLAAALISSSQCPVGVHAGSGDRPNIVFILADDLGYGELGSFGQTKIQTPRIDQLAREGLRMTHHYCGNAVCAPSRCVLLTGKDPGRATVRNNRSMPTEGQYPIPDDEITLAERLKTVGYATGVFGKWGLGGPRSTGRPLAQGFDRFTGYLCQRIAHSYYPASLWDDERVLELNNHPPVPGHAPLPEGSDPADPKSYDIFKGDDYAPSRINDAAVQFVRDHADEPFFLYYPTVIPHVALHVPDDAMRPYLDLGWNDPPLALLGKRAAYTPHFTPRAAYAGMISFMDQAVGRILDELEHQSIADHTIVVFTSDNGPTHLSQVDVDFFGSAGGFRGLKGSLDEGGIRVPTIVRWPGVIAPGSTSEYVSGFEDWMPTLLSAAGDQAAMPEGVSGVNLLPTLRGKPQSPRDYLYREFSSYGGQQMIRIGDWKAIRRGMQSGNETFELYDLASDPAQTNDLASTHADRLKAMVAKIDEAREPSRVFPLVGVDVPAKTKKRKPASLKP